MKVAVGISGGVDSAVAALLLRQQGHEVVGVTMTLGRTDEERSLAEAKLAAERIGIPLQCFDFADLWQREVVDYLRSTYLTGLTPNPCVRCNELVKFSSLPNAAFRLGCERFATGHYARVSVAADGSVRLQRAVDHAKDQSYFLYRVSGSVLARTLFPLGAMTKQEVRDLAKRFGLEVAEKSDSQDFCGGSPIDLLGVEPREGNVVNHEGKVIGTHHGFWNYTVGKRKGLGIGGGTPYYVTCLDAAKNEVHVGFKDKTIIREFSIRSLACFRDSLDGEFMVKVRSAGEPKGPVVVATQANSDIARVSCPDGLSGIAPGQSAVFFDGDTIVGGGIIT